MSEQGVAVFGCGRMGRIHITTLAGMSGVGVKWVVEDKGVHPKVQQVLASLQLRDTKLVHVGDTDRVLDDDSVTAVVICTPAPTHETLIKAALNKGKQVFCEKPIGVNTESVKSSYRLALDKGLTLYCGFQRRCDPDFKEVYTKIRNGEIGKLRIIKITCRDGPSHNTPEFIKNSGGMFVDSCVHDLDLACWLTGEHPQSLVAFGHAHEQMYADFGDVDMTSIMLKFPSGTIVTIDNSRIGSEYGYDQRLEVLGSSGMLRIENPRRSNVQHWQTMGTVMAPMAPDGTQRYHAAYKQELIHFIDIVSGKESCDMKAEGIVAVSVLIDLCKKSVETGQTLSVPEICLS